MRLLDDVAVELPPWARVTLAFFGIGFGGLAVWVAGIAGRSAILAVG